MLNRSNNNNWASPVFGKNVDKEDMCKRLYGVTHNGPELESPIPGWRYAVQPAIAGSIQPICAYKKRQPVLSRPSFYFAIRSLPKQENTTAA